MNETKLNKLWENGVPPFVKDNAKSYKEYVDKLAKRIDIFIKEGK